MQRSLRPPQPALSGGQGVNSHPLFSLEGLFVSFGPYSPAPSLPSFLQPSSPWTLQHGRAFPQQLLATWYSRAQIWKLTDWFYLSFPTYQLCDLRYVSQSLCASVSSCIIPLFPGGSRGNFVSSNGLQVPERYRKLIY